MVIKPSGIICPAKKIIATKGISAIVDRHVYRIKAAMWNLFLLPIRQPEESMRKNKNMNAIISAMITFHIASNEEYRGPITLNVVQAIVLLSFSIAVTLYSLTSP